VSLSSTGLLGGQVVQERGGLYICDRGSSHIVFQNNILREEYKLWNQDYQDTDGRIVEREIAEYEVADFITVPSSFNVRSFIKQGVDSSKLQRIPYGGNLSRFYVKNEKKGERFVVLFVGNFSIRKGAGYLLEAFSRFKHSKKELWIIGPIPRTTKRILQRFNLSSVRFLGRVENSKLIDFYNAASVFVLPSIEEGLAMVQGEAMACGCPVIVTENTGGEDLFRNNDGGFIVPIRDPRAIVEKLTLLSDDKELREKMSYDASQVIHRCGGWAIYGDQYVNFIKSVAGCVF
jgi:glycosyltransferase involved in cell wall biosynthesis